MEGSEVVTIGSLGAGEAMAEEEGEAEGATTTRGTEEGGTTGGGTRAPPTL